MEKINRKILSILFCILLLAIVVPITQANEKIEEIDSVVVGPTIYKGLICGTISDSEIKEESNGKYLYFHARNVHFFGISGTSQMSFTHFRFDNKVYMLRYNCFSGTFTEEIIFGIYHGS